MISTLQQLVGLGERISSTPSKTVNFNANLPVNVSVIKKLDNTRYRLKIGRKELTTRSQKSLQEGTLYWGNFSQDKDGILMLSDLCAQPLLFQKQEYFLESDMEDIFSSQTFSINSFKKALLEKLTAPEVDKPTFRLLSFILLGLSKGVLHLPFFKENKRSIIQIRPFNDGHELYMALENLGPIKGVLTQKGFTLNLLYAKSLYFLEKEVSKLDMIVTLGLSKEMAPLYDANELSFDIKG